MNRKSHRSSIPPLSVVTAGLTLLALVPAGRAFAQAEAAPVKEAPVETAPTSNVAPAVDTATAAAPETATPPAPPAPPPIEWKVQSKGGLMITGGNTQSKNFSFGLNGSRKEGNNKLTLEGGLAYGTTNTPVVQVDNSGLITRVDRQQVTTTNNWASKARYDRFLTPNNTTYASGQAAGDKVAGKSFFGGGQLGYSRQLVKDEMNILVAELGYDFSYERYVGQPGKTLDPVAIHSARVLVGETLTLTKQTGITASVEALFNLNKESKAINAKTGEMGVGALKDTRVNCKLALSTNLYKQLSFGFGFTAKYDQNPAPRPVPGNAPGGAEWPSGTGTEYWRLAYSQNWDTLTEATLIYTFF